MPNEKSTEIKGLEGTDSAKIAKIVNIIFFWDKKKRYMWTKSMFTSRRCVCFFSSRRTSRWPESLHKSLILAKFLSRERALSFPFITFLYSNLFSTLQFGKKKNHICLRKVCLWSTQKRPNGCHSSSATQCVELQHKSLLGLILGSAVKFVIWGL